MTGVLEGIAVKAIEAAVTAAAKNVGQRLVAGIKPSSIKSKRKALSLSNLISSLDFSDRLSLIGVLDALPNGVTLAEAQRTLTSTPMQSVIHELVATRIAGASQARRQLVRENFSLVLGQQLKVNAGKDVKVLADHIFERLDTTVDRILNEYRSVDQQGFNQMQALASSGLIDATLRAIERHNSGLARYRDTHNVHVLETWIGDYRHQVASAHGFITPP